MLTQSRRWRRAFALPALALAALALAAVPVAAVADTGDDQPAPAVEGPWIIGADADATVIVDQQGNVVMTGDAAERVRRCAATPGCWALWDDDGIGAAVIVSPTDVAGRIDAAVERAESGESP